MAGEGEGALLLSTVPLAELLHLVAALGGGLRRGGVGAAASDGGGHSVPVGSPEVAAAESVPAVTVGFNEDQGFDLGPTRRRKLPRRFLRWRGGHGWIRRK